jgi:hypothetical protein
MQLSFPAKLEATKCVFRLKIKVRNLPVAHPFQMRIAESENLEPCSWHHSKFHQNSFQNLRTVVESRKTALDARRGEVGEWLMARVARLGFVHSHRGRDDASIFLKICSCSINSKLLKIENDSKMMI